MLPLISQLQHLERNAQPVHEQRYASDPPPRRELQSAAAEETATTQPIRYHLDFRSLYEEHAPRYSACFRAGDWFRWGLPGSQAPPADGTPTCSRGEESTRQASEGCWGRCLASDVITPAVREHMASVVEEVVRAMPKYLAVRPVVGNLVFNVAPSRYEHVLKLKGYDTPSECSADCAQISNVAVEPSMCTDGVAADVVVSITKPPGLAGLAGTGGSCAADQAGRPLWLVFAWHSPVDEIISHDAAYHYGLVVHELLHGLGFSHTSFQYARDASGARKNMLELKRVTDSDGASDDVWHFTQGRAHNLAREYFGCTGTWEGLPLMGLPEAGRASHWETRIMRDDVMAYGFQDAVSAITLGAMEDLGHYRANYSAAECIIWGYRQGCAFVTTRCGVGRHDRSIEVASRAQCRGDPAWAARSDAYLNSKCEHGQNPCADESTSGYTPSTGDSSGAGLCDAQCAYGASQGDSACAVTSPTDDDPFLFSSTVAKYTNDLSWTVWLIPACCAGLLALVILRRIRRAICPADERARTIALTLGCFVSLVSLVVCGIFVRALLQYDVYAPFVARDSIFTCLCGSGAICVMALLFVWGVYRRRACVCISAFWTILAITVLLVLMSCFMYYSLWKMDDVRAESISAVRGTRVTRVMKTLDDLFSRELAVPLAAVQATLCSAYTMCCRDPSLDVSSVALSADQKRTCGAQRDGLLADLEAEVQDPSSPDFCPYITGVPAERINSLPPGVCTLIDQEVDTFSIAKCQAEFCSSGVDEYLVFVDAMIAHSRLYTTMFAVGMGITLVLNLIWAVNIRFVGKRLCNKQQNDASPDEQSENKAARNEDSGAKRARAAGKESLGRQVRV